MAESSVGIPLCEYGPCLREAVKVCLTSPMNRFGEEVKLCRPLPLCIAHLALLTGWWERYQVDPNCTVRIG